MIKPAAENRERDRRRDFIRRIQVGATGLVLVALLVGLSTLLTGEAREDVAAAEARAEAAGAPPAAVATEDPVNTLGAGPLPSTTAAAPASGRTATAPLPNTAAPAAPVVPDLQPDPRLQRPAAR